jgi:hypothetical protein
MQIRKSTKTGIPSGPDAFIRELERITGRPIISRKVGRPRKSTIDSIGPTRQAKLFEKV